jgi:DNA-directed RNA polymerase subunit RPC12/RpoP
MMKDGKALSAYRKPGKCPACGSKQVANILYGSPPFHKSLEAGADIGVMHNSPEWQCSDCKAKIYIKTTRRCRNQPGLQ